MNLEEIQMKADDIRQDIIRSLVAAGSGHSAGPLGMADIFAALFFSGVMKYDPQRPDWEERDRFILSNGHICPVLYATMAHAGFFPTEELLTLRKFGSRLQGHPHRTSLPGLETTSGPLGCGLAQANGMALGFRMDGKKNHVFVACGDGEQDEGNHWEAVMLAGKFRLSNVTAITDRNNIQIDGYTETIMPLEPLREKYESFGWFVIDIDGHNIEEIIDSVNKAKAVYERPTMILAHTIPGKGVSYMENDYKWHGNPPGLKGNVGEVVQAMEDINKLRTLHGQIESEHE
jgi:transketolase